MHDNVTALDVVVVDDEDAVDGADESGENVNRNVNHLRRAEEIPGQERDRENRSHKTARAPGNVFREDVRNVECCRNEVGDNVDAHRGNQHREAENQYGRLVVELAHDFNRVDDEFAEDHGSSRNRHHSNEREEDEVDGKTPEVAALHLRGTLCVAREVAEIKRRSAEVGDHQCSAHNHRPDGFARGHFLFGEREADVFPGSFTYDQHHQNEHGDVDNRAGPVHEAADRFHVAEKERGLENPHCCKAVPPERRKAEDVVVSEAHEIRPLVEHDDHERGARQIGLNAVPDDGNAASDKRRNIRAEDAVGHARNHRERHGKLLARHADDVGKALNNDNADNQGNKDLPAGQTEREERAGKDVAAGTVNVRHPEGEDVVPVPGLF